MSHLKNFALSASRGSMAVFIFGVVAALVGAMMLLAPAGYAQEETAAEEASVVYDEENDDGLTDEIQSVEKAIEDAPAPGDEASQVVEEPELYQNPVSVERDGDIDTVTIDDREFGAWHDSFSGEEKVSDDELYGISRKSDAGIDEIVEVEADGDVVDEDAYGFVHDDEADLDKIVIDYYGLKTTPPETLTLKIKSSEEGEYSILDADDIPAKADVQDAGFLPDPSAEKQEKIDKAKKENRAATGNQTMQLITDEELDDPERDPEVNRPTETGLQTQVWGDYEKKDIFLNRIVIHDPEGQLDDGLNKSVYIQKGPTEKCTLSGASVKKVPGHDGYIELDLQKCPVQPIVWQGSGNRVMVFFKGVGDVDRSKLQMAVYGSPVKKEPAGDIGYPTFKNGVDPQSWEEGDLVTKTEEADTHGDFKVTMTRSFDKGGIVRGDVAARVEHINGAYLDNNVFAPKLKVLDVKGETVYELSGRAGEHPQVHVEDDLKGNAWGGVRFSGVNGIEIPDGGKLVVELGHHETADAPVIDEDHKQPQGAGRLEADVKQSDDAFILVTGPEEDDIKASSYVMSRGEENEAGIATYEDIVTIDKRSRFNGATVTVKADPKYLFPGFAERYGFEIYYPGGKPDGKTGIEEGYKLVVKDSKVDRAAGIVTYSVGVATADGKPVDSALVEAGTQLSVKSLFASEPSGVETTVELKGKELKKAADKTWTNNYVHPPYIPAESADAFGANGAIFNGYQGPFLIRKAGRQEGVVMRGGICLQPNYAPPGDAYDGGNVDLEKWHVLPKGTSPIEGHPDIPEENQQIMGYIVNKLAVRGQRASVDDVKNAAKALAYEVWPGQSWIDSYPAEAHEALKTAVLMLAGYTRTDLVGIESAEDNKKDRRDRVFMRAAQVIDAFKAKDLSGENTDYLLVKTFQKTNDFEISDNGIQMVIIPGPEGEGSAQMATTASLDGSFGSYRLTEANADATIAAHDLVEYSGLPKGETFEVHTELHRIIEENEGGKPTSEIVYSSDVEKFTVGGSGSGSVSIKVDVDDMNQEKLDNGNLKPGRYVFLEKIVNDRNDVVLKHVDLDDKAQSFTITDAPKVPEPKSGKLTISKVSVDGPDEFSPVEGAEFEVRNGSKDPIPMKYDELTKSYSAEGLDLNVEYTLTEVKAPKGADGKNYQLLPEPLKFRLVSDSEDPSKALQFWNGKDGWVSAQNFPVVKVGSEVKDGVVSGTATVANVWIGDLPKTGGNGIAPWLLLGGLIMAAGALIGNRRRA